MLPQGNRLATGFQGVSISEVGTRCGVLLLWTLLFAGACGPVERPGAANSESAGLPNAGGNQTTGCIETYDPATDYFPAKAHLLYATNFAVEYHRSYKTVEVRRASYSGPGERYVLVQCGAPKPQLEGIWANATVVSVPITSMFSGSSTHTALLNTLGRQTVLTGVDDAKYASDDRVLQWIREGRVVEYAKGGVFNAEFIIANAPALLMTSENSDPAYAALRRVGIPLVANTEWMETSALGRAEWLKFMALFLNEEKRAEEHFTEVVQRYEAMKTRIKAIPESDRVTVMTGYAFRGAFSVAGGQSYVAGLIRDAGGNYVWGDNPETSFVTIDIEAQVTRASNADIWINGGNWTSVAQMTADDPRYASFKAQRKGQVWMYDRRLKDSGANDYWARGVNEPDKVLGDLIKVFYPEKAPDYEFEWYRQLPLREPQQ